MRLLSEPLFRSPIFGAPCLGAPFLGARALRTEDDQRITPRQKQGVAPEIRVHFVGTLASGSSRILCLHAQVRAVSHPSARVSVWEGPLGARARSDSARLFVFLPVLPTSAMTRGEFCEGRGGRAVNGGEYLAKRFQ